MEKETQSNRDVLIVHGRDGILEIPLTGDPKFDRVLQRFAARGGAVVRGSALMEVE